MKSLHRHKVMLVKYQIPTELEISLVKINWWKKLRESGPNIDTANGETFFVRMSQLLVVL